MKERTVLDECFHHRPVVQNLCRQHVLNVFVKYISSALNTHKPDTSVILMQCYNRGGTSRLPQNTKKWLNINYMYLNPLNKASFQQKKLLQIVRANSKQYHHQISPTNVPLHILSIQLKGGIKRKLPGDTWHIRSHSNRPDDKKPPILLDPIGIKLFQYNLLTQAAKRGQSFRRKVDYPTGPRVSSNSCYFRFRAQI